MTNKMKKIFILTPLIILLCLFGVYFLFPGVMFDLLITAERSAAGLKQHSIYVKGLRIEYLEGGKGDALMLLHGFGANKDNWTRFGKHLTSHFRVIAPDLPGFGESSPDPEGDYTIRIQTERIKAFIRALGIKSLHLGGSSMGGNIAGAYASRYPKDLKSLLLIAPGGIVSSEPSEMFRLLKEGKPNPLVAASIKDYERLLDFIFVKRPFIPRAIKKYLIQEAMEHQSLNRKIFKQLRSSVDDPPLEAMLKGLPVPTLIIWGVQDRVLHVSGAKILEAIMPKAKAEVMDAVGHLPMIEKPQETAALYLSFLEQREPGLR
ncbi:MAG: alpha/beta fold hydrolase [Desulfobacteraceae bacterium]|nr:alpha/beta fold hydrolase [Desulfobacteraceae bacterium]